MDPDIGAKDKNRKVIHKRNKYLILIKHLLHNSCPTSALLQASFRDIEGSVPDYHNNASHMNFFGFPVHVKVMFTL